MSIVWVVHLFIGGSHDLVLFHLHWGLLLPDALKAAKMTFMVLDAPVSVEFRIPI